MTSSNVVYAVGTLLSWIAWVAGIRAVWVVLELAIVRSEFENARRIKALTASGLVAGVCIVVTSLLPMHASVKTTGAFRVPLVWFVMPYSAWLGVACLVMAALRCFQGLGLPRKDRSAKFIAAGIWVLVLLAFVYLFKRDPADKIEIITGGMSWTAQTLGAVLFLGLAGMAAMVVAGRSAATRGYARTIVTQAALIAGSVVFGLPFAFLVVTSFKEDRDMSSPNGIVWVPRVQDTVPYFDKKHPMYEGSFQGQTVEGTIMAKNADGTVHLDIDKPLAIRGTSYDTPVSALKEIPKQIPVVSGRLDGPPFGGKVVNGMDDGHQQAARTEPASGGQPFEGKVVEEMDDGHRRVAFTEPASLVGREQIFAPADLQPVRHVGLKWTNYPDALSYLPPESGNGLVYLKNTLILVVMSVLGTILSSSIVAYAFSRMRFPGRDWLFAVLLSTMMLPAAVTLLPQFLIFRQLHWIDTLYPLWVPAFFASAFNVFLLRQFFKGIPMELEDAAKIDGCTYLKTFWSVMLPQIKPALAVIAIWTFMAAWNNFMGPLIYVNSPENMPLSYALQLFQGDRGTEPGLIMAFATMCMIPVLALFFFAQRYFIEGVTLSGLGGR